MRAQSHIDIIAKLNLASNKTTAAQEGYLKRYRNNPRYMLDVSIPVAARLRFLLTVSLEAVAKPNTEAAQPIPCSRLRATDQR